MELSHTHPVAGAVFDDPNLVSAAGLVPVVALAQRCRLGALADGHLSVPSDKGANAGRKVMSLVAGMVAGADSTDDMALMRCQRRANIDPLGPMANSSERRNTVSSGGRLAGVLGLPETDVARVQRWCRARVPEHVREEVRVDADVAERHVTIVECRPSWQAEVGCEWTRFPIARLRYTKATRLWSLYWRDRNLKFHAYDRVAASASVEELLAEIDRDPTAIFWG